MRKKIDVQDVQIGMYVVDLDRPWRETRFMFQGFEVRSQEDLDQLKHTCQYVYILTDYNPLAPPKPATKNPTKTDLVVEADQETGALAVSRFLQEDRPVTKHWRRDETTLEQELPQAQKIESEARTVLYNILDDARFGNSVNTSAAKEAVVGITESVIRNPDAMMVLTQLKEADQYTALHCLRVCILAITFGRHLQMTREELNLLGLGALLHDVGKMKIPPDILNKPGRLTDKEFTVMQSHVPEGLKILQNSSGIVPLSLQVVERHHERYGGAGYVNHMAGDAIGSFGLVSAIVDCYDAITSDRIYRNGTPAYEALTSMYNWRGQDFHPRLVEQFIQCMGIYPIGSLVELNNGAVGVVVSINREGSLRPKLVLVLDPLKSRYAPPRIVNLGQEPFTDPNFPVEIRKVLPPGTYGINPTEHLPIKRSTAA
ncbi:MAG TPA: HD-GYP domain-containing protein [Burkholderiales bacterium]|nr:HD-GYP domain-containing protein [Burkholderiales bacterium]